MQAQQPVTAMPHIGAIQSGRSPVAGLRPVVVTGHVKEGMNYVRKEIGRGLFHGWGKEFEEFDSGACEVSVAIVELDNGDVETYCANQIRFLDREPDGQA